MLISPQDILEALSQWVGENNRPTHDQRPWGNALTLIGTGTTDLPQNAEQVLFEHENNPPRQYVVNARGILQSAAEADLYPLAVFLVQVATEGETVTYQLDTGGEMALAVWGYRVRVAARWDTENAEVLSQLATAVTFPRGLVVSANLAVAASQGTARRTLFVPNAAPGAPSLKVPRGSRGFMIRTPLVVSANVGDVVWSAGNVEIDSTPAAAVAAEHDRGQYIEVPSAADTVAVNILATNPGLVAAEFQIRP